MRADQPPTEIICGNDVLAVGTTKQVQNMKIKVPEDISITGLGPVDN